MSLRPGLLASTSRLAAGALYPRTAPAVVQFVRAQSTGLKAKSRLEDKEGTVQHMDKQMKERQRILASMPKGIDISTQFEQVILGEPGLRTPLTSRAHHRPTSVVQSRMAAQAVAAAGVHSQAHPAQPRYPSTVGTGNMHTLTPARRTSSRTA